MKHLNKNNLVSNNFKLPLLAIKNKSGIHLRLINVKNSEGNLKEKVSNPKNGNYIELTYKDLFICNNLYTARLR